MQNTFILTYNINDEATASSPFFIAANGKRPHKLSPSQTKSAEETESAFMMWLKTGLSE